MNREIKNKKIDLTQYLNFEKGEIIINIIASEPMSLVPTKILKELNKPKVKGE